MKAKALVEKFKGYSDPTFEEEDNDGSLYLTSCSIERFNNAKQCALICVEEIIEELYKYPSLSEIVEQRQDNGYWQQVKTEIEKL